MSKSHLCFVAGVLLVAAQVWAAPLLPGTSALAPAEPDPLGATLVAGPLVSTLTGAAFNATVTSWVYQGDTTNPFGGLTFVYQVANEDTSTDAIGRFTANGYMTGSTVWATDGSFQVGAGLLPPATMDRSANGNVVGFSFVGPPLGPAVLAPGATSTMLVVQTDAPDFTRSTGNVIDGSIASGPIYAPVPEPATMLFLAGGLGMALLRRRR
jgi:hypothetical protein